MDNQIKVNANRMPKYESDLLCKTLIRSITKLFEDPAVKADYEHWKLERDTQQSTLS